MFEDNDLDPFGFDDTALLGEVFHTSQDNRGLCRSQRPLSARHIMPKDATRSILVQMGCSDLAQIKDRALDAFGAIFANLALARLPCTLFYSRDRGHYAGCRRYLPKHFSYLRVTHAVDTFDERGLLNHSRTRPSPHANLRSYFSASEKLAERLNEYADACTTTAPKELVVLRDRKRSPVHYTETEETLAMRRELSELNEYLSSFSIAVDHPDAIEAGPGHLIINGQLVNLSLKNLYRVFTQTFRENGRFYGGFWQNLPQAVRRTGILIDNQPVVELDYRACHLRILCGLIGRPLPFHDLAFDPFTIRGFERRLVKIAFVVLLNTRSKKGAVVALARALAEHRGCLHPEVDELQLSRALLQAVDETFPFLRPYWCKRFGLRLLNFDAAICAENLSKLKSNNVPCLSVHDSFIVPAQHRDLLHNIMETGFSVVMKKIRE